MAACVVVVPTVFRKAFRQLQGELCPASRNRQPWKAIALSLLFQETNSEDNFMPYIIAKAKRQLANAGMDNYFNDTQLETLYFWWLRDVGCAEEISEIKRIQKENGD